MNQKVLIGALLALLVLVLAGLSIAVPMSSANLNTTIGGHSNTLGMNATFFGGTSNGTYTSWSNLSSSTSGSSQSSQINGGITLIYISLAMTILGMIFAILWLVGLFIKLPASAKRIFVWMPVLAGILLLISVVLFNVGASSIVNALTADVNAAISGFGGSASSTLSLSYGSYLIIVGLVLSFAGSALAFLPKTQKTAQ